METSPVAIWSCEKPTLIDFFFVALDAILFLELQIANGKID